MSANADGLASGDVGNDVKTDDFVTVYIADQLFGIPVLEVQDVLRHEQIGRIPMTPPEIAGSLNLRGRIVTAINVRQRIGLEEREGTTQQTSVVVDHHGELYALVVDKVGEVMTMPEAAFEKNPATLDPLWRSVSSGIYQLEGRLLVVLDVIRLLDFSVEAAA
ncbi:MAG: chemotaxis protein CheW [Pseudomonadota bacterium]